MSKAVRLLPFCALSVSLFSSSGRADPRKPTHVACVGDSITSGAGASDTSKNYVSLLQGLLGNTVQVKNFGHSGATLLSAGFGDLPYNMQSEYTGATDFVSNAGANAVVSVIIMLGTNDSKPYNWEPSGKPKNDQQYLADYRTLVDHFSGLSTKPVVYVVYPLAAFTNSYSISGDVIHDQELPLIKQLAMEKHLPIIDLNTPTLTHPEYLGDGVHPNDAGYVVMANLVKMGLERVPTVSITSPTMGAMPGAGMLPLTADASADTVDIASVEFFEGATSLGKVSAKPFTLSWQATAGMHQITAKATDTTLANATSMPVSFTVTAATAGGTGGGNAGGAGGTGGASAGAAAGGVATGGGATGGSSAAGSSAMAGGVAGAATSGSGGVAGSVAQPPPAAPDSSADSGCSCALPGSRDRGGLGLSLLGAALLSLRALRRRRALRA